MHKKLLCLYLGLAMLVISLSACSKSEDKPADTEVDVSEEVSGDTAKPRPHSFGKKDKNTESPEQEGVKHIPISIEEKSYSVTDPETYRLMAECNYFNMIMDEETAKLYPKLNEEFELYNNNEDIRSREMVEKLREDYLSMSSYVADSDMYLSDHIKPHVMRSDSNIISILCEADNFLGGAHGYYWSYGLNYDPESGKELHLSDVVPEKEKFIELISDKFKEKYSDYAYDETVTDAGEYLASMGEDQYESWPWSMDSEGITVYFAPYNLGSYALGAQEISIYFDEAPVIFNDKYFNTCEEYVIPLVNSRSYELRLGDGSLAEVAVELDAIEEYDAYAIEYKIGNVSIKFDDYYCYSADNYIVYSGGKHYIYSFSGTENDYVILNVVDIENKSFDSNRSENAYLYEPIVSWEDGGDYYSYSNGGPAFTDPESFVVGRRLQLLGTGMGYKTYHVGEDGYPVSEDEYYMMSNGFAFKAVKDLELDTVDEAGKVTGTKKVSAGTYLFNIRTDGESVVDLQLIDESEIEISGESDWKTYMIKDQNDDLIDLSKTIYRVKVDDSDWPPMVNGQEEDSVFEGVMYAG